LLYRQGHTLYDRMPRPRSLWKRAEELTGEKLIAYSFGTPTEKMAPGPLARLGAFLHGLSAAEALAKSGRGPTEAVGLGEGLLAAAVWAGALDLDLALGALHGGDYSHLEVTDPPATPLRSMRDPDHFPLGPAELEAELRAVLPVVPALEPEAFQGLLGAWRRDRVQSVVVPGPAGALPALVRKLDPEIQCLPASELDEIASAARVAG